ncbi:MAG: type II toxin-antitoxin system HicB family antitoxin [bacterium]|nr:type II toxin-antitoxin system HicB family antitoxin [bacterium]
MSKRILQQQFKVLIERDEDGFLVASVPALPGCHTQAKTLPDLIKRVRDAIRLCLEVSKTNRKYRSRLQRFAYEPTFVGMEMVTI